MKKRQMQNRRPILEKHKQYFSPVNPRSGAGAGSPTGRQWDTDPPPGHTAPAQADPQAGAPQHRSGHVPSPAATPSCTWPARSPRAVTDPAGQGAVAAGKRPHREGLQWSGGSGECSWGCPNQGLALLGVRSRALESPPRRCSSEGEAGLTGCSVRWVLWMMDTGRMCGREGCLGGQAQAAVLAPARLTWGVAKKLEEERKWRSKDLTKPRRQDFKL